jgi:pimeloyl-ACP methyl ester carboxylesterase
VGSNSSSADNVSGVTRLTLGERSIEVAWWGPRSALTPVVLLHEGLGSVSLWRDFPEALAAGTGRRVMAYSRFGHGESDPPAEPHTVQFMHDEARCSRLCWMPPASSARISRAQ